MSLYLIIAKVLPPVLELWVGGAGFWTQKWFVLAAASALVLPLMLLRQITSLRYSSLFALCSILYVVTVIAYYGATGPLATQEGPLLLWPDPGSDLL